ncbi:MAG TPA: hypothetical protein DEA90_12935 [Opitutae bacterium]|nr:hypothetical protein [Puniceicoccaceae bacterium]HBR95058.1 hypothetical protein [Opitutae bacterium]|tara:strand:+ start:3915 stop:4412 length:498 start_codon:yes stop_codon:yes gene_type:complete
MPNFQNIADHGITADSAQPCGRSLNQLLKGSHRHWFVPAGKYIVEETLRLPSGTHLKLHPQATLQLADGAAQRNEDYLLTNADHEKGNVSIRIEGGVFDGNQVGNRRPEGLLDAGYSGAMLHFQNVKQLALLHTTLTNSEAYYARFTHSKDHHPQYPRRMQPLRN